MFHQLQLTFCVEFNLKNSNTLKCFNVPFINNYIHAAKSFERLTVTQIVKKFHLLWNLKFCTYSRESITGPLFLTTLIKSTPPHPDYLVLSSQLHLPSVLFPSGSLTKVMYKFLTSHVNATCPTHLVILDFILIMFCEHHKLWRSSLYSFSNFPSFPSS